MSQKNGGTRPGAGRKHTYTGEKTTPVRIPESQLTAVRHFLATYRQQGNAPVTHSERLAYTLHLHRLKQSLAGAVTFLKKEFRPIPVIQQKISDLQQAHDAPIPLATASTTAPVQSWEKQTYTPAGAYWQLSGAVAGKQVVFCSTLPAPLPSAASATTPHLYPLTLQEIDTLIAFLLNARHSIAGGASLDD